MANERHLQGRLLRATCRSADLAQSYSITNASSDETIADLAPGLWLHTLQTDLGQRQHQTSLLLTNTSATRISFIVYASVFTVGTAEDRIGAGSLRDALSAAAAMATPLLIQFAEEAFPPGDETLIPLVRVLPPLSASNVTIDATDSSGNKGTPVVDVGGRNAGGLLITGASNTVTGLALRNAGGNGRDLISISGALAAGNVIDGCIVQNTSGDGIGVDGGAGRDFETSVNVIRNCDVSAAGDKGIKVTTDSYARLENNWVHDNANGGVQATLSGHISVIDNLIERSGGASAQNGLALNGAGIDTPGIPSVVYSDGNILRDNGANGVSVRGYSRALLRNDYVITNASSGIRVFDQGIRPAAAAVVQGMAVACNAINGAVVADASTADFGGGPIRGDADCNAAVDTQDLAAAITALFHGSACAGADANGDERRTAADVTAVLHRLTGAQLFAPVQSSGNNAFTQTGQSAANLRNATSNQVYALNNQWEHCGTASSCDESMIAAYDLSDRGLRTRFQPAQAHRSRQPPALHSTRPAKALEGARLRIFGSGFNAIDAHADGAECADLSQRNSCQPLRGNCVLIDGVAAPLEAVTPTMLVIRMPFSCVEPKLLSVRTQGGGVSNTIEVCTNPPHQAVRGPWPHLGFTPPSGVGPELRP